MPSWLPYALLAVGALIALAAFVWAWRVDSENQRLRARIAQCDAAIAHWHEWARSEGWGHTRVVSR